jgi:hypothetical protein
MPGVSGVTVVDLLGVLFSFAPEAAGAASARHSLRPQFLEGQGFCDHSGAFASRECCDAPDHRHSGARLGASYDVQLHIVESMSPGVIAARWIPGLRLSAHPGMTKSSLRARINLTTMM